MKQLAVFGLTISSSWGNGHATTYRSLLAGLHRRGWQIVFYEREAHWYASNRDLTACEYAEICLYPHWAAVRAEALRVAAASELTLVGSYCPDGATVLDELLAAKSSHGSVLSFYDIDTPITLGYLRGAGCDYLRADQIPRLDLYLSFTAGPMLRHLEAHWGARRARALPCGCDPEAYAPGPREHRWDLGYIGTYAPDRQAKLEALLLRPARRLPQLRFVVAGPMYPAQAWPENVSRVEHIGPSGHPGFYRSCRWCLNLTRQAMVEWGYSPSIRLFEAAACGTPILSDPWSGSGAFFASPAEMVTVESSEAVERVLTTSTDAEWAGIAAAARRRVVAEHSGHRRAEQLEAYWAECRAPARCHPERAA
ncbi:MAG: CgeB family protein [Terriglobales bacterium]